LPQAGAQPQRSSTSRAVAVAIGLVVVVGAVDRGALVVVAWPVAHRAFVTHTAAGLAAPLPPVAVLGIDETRRGG